MSNVSKLAHIDLHTTIAATAKVWHFTVIRTNVQIGHNSVIGHNVVIEKDTRIGNRTTIQSQCHITANAIIGNDVFFGPGVVTMNEKLIANNGRREPKIERLLIGNGARIGAGATLAPGITIGANAMIQANAFVTKDVPAGEYWGMRNGFAKATRIGSVPKEEWL